MRDPWSTSKDSYHCYPCVNKRFWKRPPDNRIDWMMGAYLRDVLQEKMPRRPSLVCEEVSLCFCDLCGLGEKGKRAVTRCYNPVFILLLRLLGDPLLRIKGMVY